MFALLYTMLHDDYMLIYIMFDLTVLHRMGSDWNQVMSQYGSFLSQIDE